MPRSNVVGTRRWQRGMRSAQVGAVAGGSRRRPTPRSGSCSVPRWQHRGTWRRRLLTRHCASRRTFSSRCCGYRVPLPRARAVQWCPRTSRDPGHTAHRVRGRTGRSGLGLYRGARGRGSPPDAAIAAVHHNPVSSSAHCLRESWPSALTIGSGGSGGREGPTGQISAGSDRSSPVPDLKSLDARITVAERDRLR